MYPYNISISEISEAENSNDNTKLIISADTQTVSDMLIDAVKDEAHDYAKYMAISKKIENPTDAETVKSIAYDEYKHKRIFEEIFKALTGTYPTAETTNAATDTGEDELTMLETLTNSFFGELEAVEMYREIMSAFANNNIRELVFEVITDEQTHADILNYLMPKFSNME